MTSDLTERLVALARQPVKFTELAITASIGTTGLFIFRRGSSFAVRRTAGSVATLTVYAAEKEDGTYTQVNIEGTLQTITVDANWRDTDPKLFTYEFLKFVGNTTGTIQIVEKG